MDNFDIPIFKKSYDLLTVDYAVEDRYYRDFIHIKSNTQKREESDFKTSGY